MGSYTQDIIFDESTLLRMGFQRTVSNHALREAAAFFQV